MGVPSSAGPDLGRTPHRPLRSTFLVMVIAPAIFLTAAWLAAASLAIGGVLGGHRLSSLSHSQLAEIAALAAGGGVVILITLLLAGSFARRVARDLTSLTIAARQLAAGQPVQASEAGLEAGSPAESSSRRGSKTTEIAQATGAIAGLQETAAAAAASEAGMRDGLRQVIVSLARRNQSLLQRQLRLIDALEQKAADPGALADLFALDHLTTRMRRHAESLAILAGAAPGRSWREPVPVIDVIRGAMAEVEDYQRVAVLTQAEDAISGSAAADMIHLLAELIENATLFSPSGTAVEVRAGRVANGFAIEVDDRGLGIEPDQLTAINREMENPPDFDLANSDRLGLFVGGKLAARYGVRVSLRASPYGGTTAIVLLPNNIVVPVGGVGIALQPAIVHPAIAGTSVSDARTVEPLALVGPRRLPPAPRAAESLIGTVPGGTPSPVSPVQVVPQVQPAPRPRSPHRAGLRSRPLRQPGMCRRTGRSCRAGRAGWRRLLRPPPAPLARRRRPPGEARTPPPDQRHRPPGETSAQRPGQRRRLPVPRPVLHPGPGRPFLRRLLLARPSPSRSFGDRRRTASLYRPGQVLARRRPVRPLPAPSSGTRPPRTPLLLARVLLARVLLARVLLTRPLLTRPLRAQLPPDRPCPGASRPASPQTRRGRQRHPPSHRSGRCRPGGRYSPRPRRPRLRRLALPRTPEHQLRLARRQVRRQAQPRARLRLPQPGPLRRRRERRGGPAGLRQPGQSPRRQFPGHQFPRRGHLSRAAAPDAAGQPVSAPA